MRVLVTGGAGFIGANLALGLSDRHPEWELIALDNLRRRGCELNLPRLREAGVRFVHGDVRDAAISPRRRARRAGGVLGGAVRPGRGRREPRYVVQTNLFGAFNCLELRAPARRPAGLSVDQPRLSRRPLSSLTLTETRRRGLSSATSSRSPGASPAGIAEDFPLVGARTLVRRDEALGRAADRGVPRRVRPPGRDRPLRGDRRTVADGQGRPGCVHVLDAGSPLRPPAAVHRLRRQRQAGARPAARRGSGRRCSRSSYSTRIAGTARPSTSAAAASAASRCWRRRRCAPRSPAPERRGRGGRPETRPGDRCRLYVSDCLSACSRLTSTGAHGAVRGETSWLDIDARMDLQRRHEANAGLTGTGVSGPSLT